MNKIVDNSIIALDKFIQSTRDSGYKSTANAVAELVDNSIQAGAKVISILIKNDASGDLSMAVLDNGCGMDKNTLTQALRFGGSSRFNDREGMGRFGMGLPNASLSQARRIEVYSWQGSSKPNYTYLDVDEISLSKLTLVPKPVIADLPDWIDDLNSENGTVVIWKICDRLDNKRISTIESKLHQSLGRIFRYYLWDGVQILINKKPILPIDPLYLSENSTFKGASKFQDPWTLEIYANPENPNSLTGKVEVSFTELPISKWHSLPNEEKRRLGVSNGSGVSIVRGKREVDFGWYFMGNKRRENYDDWWRCEVKFDPILDESFGITHSKQQIKPKEYLLEALEPYIESMAKALNGRVRQSHIDVKISNETFNAEKLAKDRDSKLRPLPSSAWETSDISKPDGINELAKRHTELKSSISKGDNSSPNYHIIEDDMADSCFFKPIISNGLVVGVINPKHAFYKKIYKPAMDNASHNPSMAKYIQLMILSAARAEAALMENSDIDTIERYRREWSNAMDVLLA